MLKVTDYDKSEIDWRKPHTIVGDGTSKDLVIQNGRYYTHYGKRIPNPTPEALKKEGIPYTTEIANVLEIDMLRKREQQLRDELQKQIAELEQRERERVMLGLSSPTFEDRSEVEEPTAEEQVEQIDLSGLDELEQEIAQPAKPAPKARAKKK